MNSEMTSIKQEGGYESTKLRYASMSIPNEKTCGDYTDQEFQSGSMICASSNAAIRKRNFNQLSLKID